jgi:hypothetical protein
MIVQLKHTRGKAKVARGQRAHRTNIHARIALDAARLAEVRQSLPALQHRTL